MKARLYALTRKGDPLVHGGTFDGALVARCGTYVSYGQVRRDIAVTCLRCLGAL